jgi:hypothetical protein
MDLKVWFDQGKKDGATHMLVVCDTFDYGDYPAYVGKDENVHDRITYYKLSPMQMIMEVYDLSMDRDEQLSTPRVYNYPQFPKDYKYTGEKPWGHDQ